MWQKWKQNIQIVIIISKKNNTYVKSLSYKVSGRVELVEKFPVENPTVHV